MLKLLAIASPTLLAATIAVGAADFQVVTSAEQSPPPQQVTVVGCVVRNGSVDVDKGTRVLNIAPGALALTGARVITSGNRSTGVPGASTREHDSGTIPQETIVGKQSGGAPTLAFALTGNRMSGIGDLVGRRVEVVGRTTPTESSSAHPSTDLQKLEVVSFRGVTGPCA